MTDLIRRLTTWTYGLLTGLRSNSRRRPPTPVLPIGRPHDLTPPLPLHRSSYAQDDTPLDATANRSVRPYLIAHERRHHRHEMAMAALGQDMPESLHIHRPEAA
ncbi:hypothetical protein [Streptomyces hawaiiensis]|uniref:hypothetical protein n=1 Tax=Streptomyces hawaiiensis TaxID=67305 RepID=UPI00366750E7